MSISILFLDDLTGLCVTNSSHWGAIPKIQFQNGANLYIFNNSKFVNVIAMECLDGLKLISIDVGSEFVRLEFEQSAALVISMLADDWVGPEAFYVSHGSNEFSVMGEDDWLEILRKNLL